MERPWGGTIVKPPELFQPEGVHCSFKDSYNLKKNSFYSLVTVFILVLVLKLINSVFSFDENKAVAFHVL